MLFFVLTAGGFVSAQQEEEPRYFVDGCEVQVPPEIRSNPDKVLEYLRKTYPHLRKTYPPGVQTGRGRCPDGLERQQEDDTQQEPDLDAASPWVLRALGYTAYSGLNQRTGEPVKKDYGKAVFFFQKAAAQGDAVSQAMLGLMYFHGEGVRQDFVEAASWYRKAAEQSEAYAQGMLGGMYLRGKGVLQDYIEAHAWSNLAAASVTTDKARELWVKNRDDAAAQLTRTDLKEARRRARELKAALARN